MKKFFITKSASGEFSFNFGTGNDEVILSSEPYSTKQVCENGIYSVKKNAVNEYRFVRNSDENNMFHFELKAGNGQVICKSRTYLNEADCEKNIETLKRQAPGADIVDLTKK